MITIKEKWKKRIDFMFLLGAISALLYMVMSILLPFFFNGFHSPFLFSIKIQLGIFFFTQLGFVIPTILILIKIKRRLVYKMKLNQSVYTFITLNDIEISFSKNESFELINKPDYYLNKFFYGSLALFFLKNEYEFKIIKYENKKLYIIPSFFENADEIQALLI